MKKEYSLDAARTTTNKVLNRYRDVYPYDHSRVILSRDDYDYINASHVVVREDEIHHIH